MNHPTDPKATKAIVAAVVGLIGVLLAWYTSGQFDEEVVVAAVTAVVSTLGVYLSSNR